MSEATMYLISFKGIKKGSRTFEHHNLATPVPPSMLDATDEALKQFAIGYVIGTLGYKSVTNILIVEE